MIKGKLKEIVPYFDRANESFVNYQEIPKAGFSSSPDEYFLDRYEGESFEIESWLDIIAAPYFIISKEQKTGDDYSQPLYDLFYQLFPTATEYQVSLDKQADNLWSCLYDLRIGNSDKGSILSSIRELMRNITRVSELLIPLQAQFSDDMYLLSSLKSIAGFRTKLNEFYDTISLTSDKQIKYDYYSGKRGISWEEDPLAFFKNILYADGIGMVLQEMIDDEQKYGDIDTKENYFERLYRREYHISFKLIDQNLSKGRSKAEKQKYADEISSQLSILFNKSLTHFVKDHYLDHLRPYQSLIRNLQEKYKGLTFNVGYTYEKEEELMLVETPLFQRKLLSLKIMDNEGRERSLFKGTVSVLQLGLLIKGDTDSIPEVHFNWDNETVHYLLYKLRENHASFFLSKLSKKAFNRDGQSYSPGGYSTFKSEFKAGKIKRIKAFDQIDALFS